MTESIEGAIERRLRLVRQLVALAITAKDEIKSGTVEVHPEKLAYDIAVAAAVALFGAPAEGATPDEQRKRVRSTLFAMISHMLGDDVLEDGEPPPVELGEELRRLWNESVEEALPFLERRARAESGIIAPPGAR